MEAKKPSVNIKDDPDPAYQLRRYAWSAKLPLSILTDFEELAVYDCRIKPSHSDKPSAGRVQYIGYRDYLKEWESIASVFSREAVLKGSFDKYVESNKAKRGTAEVDAAFLNDIETWRDELAHNLALRNPSLTTRELNFAVQATIDRIIFLRICEDRGVEDYARLMASQNASSVYKRLMELFRSADERYNSGLFHFEPEKGRENPDTLTPKLIVDDKVLKDVLKGLYYPESPYEFSVLPADILGQVYEQFLGKVIRLTAGHQAKVEDKPEVKKAGGVYYTPTYIVDYIVKNTVGKMLEGKTPAQVSGRRGGALPPPAGGHGEGGHGGPPLRILDPACGSGSFLLGAYQYLLTWYRDRYFEDGAAKWARRGGPLRPPASGRTGAFEPALYQASGGEWKLTTSERKRVLLNHIYGVDIDAQAVEVTKLSLLLKVLEGETKESVSYQRKLFHERALPDLSRNIKCGNSLIGSDFYKGQQVGLFDEEERIRINAFDWEDEFPEVFSPRRSGEAEKKRKFTTENTEDTEKGFDVVIGNPPYVSFGLRDVGKLTQEESDYYRRKFAGSAEYKLSLYAVFMQLAVDVTRTGGAASMIVPDSFLLGRFFSKLRHHILGNCSISELLFLPFRVFAIGTVGASVVFNVTKAPFAEARSTKRLKASLAQDSSEVRAAALRSFSYPQAVYDATKHNRFRLFFCEDDIRIVERIENGNVIPLGTIVKLCSGLIGKAGKSSIVSNVKKSQSWFPGLQSGDEIGRYKMQWAGGYICNDQSILKSGFKDAQYDKPKLLCRQTGDSIIATFDDTGVLCLNNLHVGNLLANEYDLKYVLAIVNSILIDRYYGIVSLEKGRPLAQTDIETLHTIPIPAIDLTNPSSKKRHSAMVSLVNQMLSLHKQLQAARTEQDKTLLQRQIAATDKEIDRLVYDLYGLTDDEIAIVEGS